MFGIVIFSVVGVSGLVAIGIFLFAGPPHGSIGGNGFAPPPPPGSEPAEMREDDVRQMLEARNRRRIARGQPGGDVEAELAMLLAPQAESPAPASGEVRAEAEAIVAARQSRRRRRGRPEGDFEAEVAELLRTIGAE